MRWSAEWVGWVLRLRGLCRWSRGRCARELAVGSCFISETIHCVVRCIFRTRRKRREHVQAATPEPSGTITAERCCLRKSTLVSSRAVCREGDPVDGSATKKPGETRIRKSIGGPEASRSLVLTSKRIPQSGHCGPHEHRATCATVPYLQG